MDNNHGQRATRWISITPSDTTDCVGVYGIFTGDGGDIALMGDDGNVEVFTLGAGQILPCAPKRVMESGTEASDIIGLG